MHIRTQNALPSLLDSSQFHNVLLVLQVHLLLRYFLFIPFLILIPFLLTWEVHNDEDKRFNNVRRKMSKLLSASTLHVLKHLPG
mmetsp:Transcript_16837/g.68805  ORF Transcript_16837/g.68805 Transcript_16837/m.68805 type:complete len:84 (+) Transcript_16837:476-727(+)